MLGYCYQNYDYGECSHNCGSSDNDSTSVCGTEGQGLTPCYHPICPSSSVG